MSTALTVSSNNTISQENKNIILPELILNTKQIYTSRHSRCYVVLLAKGKKYRLPGWFENIFFFKWPLAQGSGENSGNKDLFID